MRAHDLTGQIFGMLEVLRFAHRDARRVAHWACRCSCGKEVVVAGNNLRSGNSTTCGCVYGIHISEPITHEQLCKLVEYVPRTGLFHWRVNGRAYKKGDEAGYYHPANGYVRVVFKKQQYYAHVLAWFYMKGAWPSAEVDHEDLDGKNNRWSNLRLATHAENVRNARIRSHSRNEYKGVWASGKKFCAKIMVAGKHIPLGSFENSVLAAKAYDAAALKYHGKFARLNFGDQ